MKKKIKESYQDLMSGKSPILAIICLVAFGLIVLLILPFILTRPGLKPFNYTDTGQIGDTIGGIAGPSIAFLAALLTFLAFWVQFRANKLQVEQFNKQNIDTKIERFESKYYEMLRIHRDNVSEFNIVDVVQGRKVFITMYKELKFAFLVLKNIYTSLEERKLTIMAYTDRELLNIAYLVFYMGVGEISNKHLKELLWDYDKNLITPYLDSLGNFQNRYITDDKLTIDEPGALFFELDIRYIPFNGHISRLSHYFRHLYQTVKFVVDYDSEIITDKDQYLKTIRAQLSAHEQLMLYYNGLTDLGRPWIDNEYFTTHKMIKNIPIPLADFGIQPKEQFGSKNNKNEFIFEWDEILSN